MKKHFTIILIFVSLNIFSQETPYQIKIDSLNNLIAKNDKQIKLLQQDNQRLINDIKEVQFKIDSVIIKQSNSDILYSTYAVAFHSDSELNNRLENIPNNSKVGLIEVIGDTYKIIYNNQIGYAKKYNFITEFQYKKKEQEKIQEEKDKLKEQELAKQREIEAAKQRKLIKEKEELNKKKALAERTKELIKKYGSINGKLVAEGRVAIGMNQKMVIDSWGKPSDINKSIYSFGIKEQWVYGLGNYVYFEDGIVTSISTRN